jgi:Spy/CpxP family protein refolding chaperone
MFAMKHSSQNPANLLGWDQKLNLTDEQRARLRAIEDKAAKEAKDLLTAEQQDKLEELATPQSMMQCMPPMKHAGPTAGEIEHGVSVGCSHVHGKAEEAHSSH